MEEAEGGLSPYPVIHSVPSGMLLPPDTHFGHADPVQHENVIDSLASEEKMVTSRFKTSRVVPAAQI